MTEQDKQLPESVRVVEIEGGRCVYLVGTAHVSKESVEDVRSAVEAANPDAVAVELCEGRYKAMTDRDNWKQMNIFKVLKEKKAVFLLGQLVMSSFYKRLGEKLGVEPGAEMLEGIRQADSCGAKLVLADRKIETTLRRVWGYLGFWNKMKLFSSMLVGLLEREELDEQMIEKIKQSDQLESIMGEFAQKYPEIKRRLIDERDIYLSQKIREAEFERMVAVVGAGHVGGICEHIHADHDLGELEVLPAKSIWPTVFKWGIPLAIIGLIVLGFFKNQSPRSLYIWFGVNGTLSALGSAIALGHPLTVIASFLAAPITSLNPFSAAGWVAGVVQAWIRKPTVEDFEILPESIHTAKGFWRNPVTKILLVVAFANIGSGFGTWIALTWMAKEAF
jgi:pheromone shutdown-related protein TraB